MQSIRYRSGRLVLGALLAGLLAACSSVPRPTTEISAARTSIDSATQAGAADTAALARARDSLAAAELAAAKDDNLNARRLAELAKADAQLAETRAEAERSEQAALELETSLDSLRREMSRGSGR